MVKPTFDKEKELVHTEMKKVFKEGGKDYDDKIKGDVTKILEGIDDYRKEDDHYLNFRVIQEMGINLYSDADEGFLDKDYFKNEIAKSEEISEKGKKALIDIFDEQEKNGSSGKLEEEIKNILDSEGIDYKNPKSLPSFLTSKGEAMISSENMKDMQKDLKEKYGEDYILKQSDVQNMIDENPNLVEEQILIRPKMRNLSETDIRKRVEEKIEQNPNAVAEAIERLHNKGLEHASDKNISAEERKNFNIDYNVFKKEGSQITDTAFDLSNFVEKNELTTDNNKVAGVQIADIVSKYVYNTYPEKASEVIKTFATKPDLTKYHYANFKDNNKSRVISERSDIEKSRYNTKLDIKHDLIDKLNEENAKYIKNGGRIENIKGEKEVVGEILSKNDKVKLKEDHIIKILETEYTASKINEFENEKIQNKTLNRLKSGLGIKLQQKDFSFETSPSLKESMLRSEALKNKKRKNPSSFSKEVVKNTAPKKPSSLGKSSLSASQIKQKPIVEEEIKQAASPQLLTPKIGEAMELNDDKVKQPKAKEKTQHSWSAGNKNNEARKDSTISTHRDASKQSPQAKEQPEKTETWDKKQSQIESKEEKLAPQRAEFNKYNAAGVDFDKLGQKPETGKEKTGQGRLSKLVQTVSDNFKDLINTFKPARPTETKKTNQNIATHRENSPPRQKPTTEQIRNTPPPTEKAPPIPEKPKGLANATIKPQQQQQSPPKKEPPLEDKIINHYLNKELNDRIQVKNTEPHRQKSVLPEATQNRMRTQDALQFVKEMQQEIKNPQQAYQTKNVEKTQELKNNIKHQFEKHGLMQGKSEKDLTERIEKHLNRKHSFLQNKAQGEAQAKMSETIPKQKISGAEMAKNMRKNKHEKQEGSRITVPNAARSQKNIKQLQDDQKISK